MKICVLVKEVPDAAVNKRIDPETKRLDRSGEKNLNPFDTHALEAAMQVKEGGADGAVGAHRHSDDLLDVGATLLDLHRGLEGMGVERIEVLLA